MKEKNDSKLRDSLNNEQKLKDLVEDAEKLNVKELLEAQGGVDADLDNLDCYQGQCTIGATICDHNA